MTDGERIDFLMDALMTLYEIRQANKEKNDVLEHKIRAMEARLAALGVTDLQKLEP